METASYVAVDENCTGGLVIEVFDDSDKVRTDVELVHGYPQSCMPNPVEGLLEVCEYMVEILLMLEVVLTNDSQVEDLLCFAPSCSSAMIFSACGFNLFTMIFCMTLLGWLMRLIAR